MTDAPPGPYAAAAADYWRLGWSPLPLPARRKSPVPEGWTGTEGAIPSFPDVHAWIESKGRGNIGLRLPIDVIGIDVDNYGGKPGGMVLGALEADLGALPATWRSTSRDDGISGIRLYRIPPGLRWPGVLGPGIEVIRFEHRYAVVWPSIHPDTGGTYRWITPDGVTSLSDLPAPGSLPDLPEAWVERFTRGERAVGQPKVDLTDGATSAWLSARGSGLPCPLMVTIADRCVEDIKSATSRHEVALAVTNRIVWLVGEGHQGGLDALNRCENAFLDVVSKDRGAGEGEAEWARMVSGAVRMSAAAHPDQRLDPCSDPFADILPDREPEFPISVDLLDAYETPVETPAESVAEATDESPSAAAQEVSTRLKSGGSWILDLPETVPAIWGRGEQVLWAAGEALTLCGPAGVGKTTLTGQVLKARLVGGEVLGLPVTPTTSKVLYLAMDRPRQIARALRRVLGSLPREVLDERLVVWQGPPIADVAEHPKTLLGLAHLAGADTIIIDSIKDAAVGLSSDEVGAGYNRARQLCIAEGIEVLEQHHMVKKGEGGAPPTTLADLYGSVWIGAGSGSVVLLHGKAGDLVVSMRHLKTPADEVGPWSLLHDPSAGTTDIYHSTDIVAMARLAGSQGITAKAVARAVQERDTVSKNEVEQARRRLDGFAKKGYLVKQSNGAGRPDTWLWLTDQPYELVVDNAVDNEDHGAADRGHAGVTQGVLENGGHEGHAGVTDDDVSAGQRGHANGHGGHEPWGVTVSPPLKGGEPPPTPEKRRLKNAVVAGKQVVVDLDTGEVSEE